MKLLERILSLLIHNKDKEYTIREISIKLKTDYKNTYDAVQRIQDSINIRKIGNSSLINFKPILTNLTYIVEKRRKEEIKKSIKTIIKDIENIENPFFIAILFGSYAKKNQTKHSDIDICIIHDNNEELKKIKSNLSIHPKIEIHDFNYKEFISLLKNKEFNVGHEIVKDGIILKNIENYYGLIKYE